MLKTAILLHIRDAVYLNDFKAAIDRLPTGVDLYINQVTGICSDEKLAQQTDTLREVFPNAVFTRTEDRGQEIGGMFRLFSKIQNRFYQAILFAHSESNDEWRKKMLLALSEHAGKAMLQLGTTRHSPRSEVGMVGNYIYPYDYYHLAQYMQLADEFGIALETTWDNFYQRYPSVANMTIEQRVSWASQMQVHEGRPEIDLEYAYAKLGAPGSHIQDMNPELARRFIDDGVYGPLPYFPGNFFWLNGKILDALAKKMDFKEEFMRLEKGQPSVNSRALAWERFLPVFVVKSGFRITSLE